MTWALLWDILNSLGRLIVTIVATVIVTVLRDELNESERVGLGLMGSGSFLTIGIIWEGHDSPFDGWAVTIMTYGMVLFLLGYGHRRVRHWRRNAVQYRQSRDYLKSRGKL